MTEHITTPAQTTPTVIVVPLRPCCGALPGDCCDCAAEAAEAVAALTGAGRPPILLPTPLAGTATYTGGEPR